MLYRIGHTREVAMLPGHLPKKLLTEIFHGLVVLDAEYGEERDYMESGGYSLIAENREDILEMKKYLNVVSGLPEWATEIGSTGYVSALYIRNDDFSVMVYMPLETIPDEIRKELEESV